MKSKDTTILKIPPSLLGTTFRTLYRYKKYHSGTMCEGVTSGLIGIMLIGWDKVSIVKDTIEKISASKRIVEVMSLNIK